MPLIKSLKLNNFLSFGDTAEAVELEDLNLIIGPNGAGKSNLLEAIDLLRNAPEQLLKPIRDGGGVHDWLWKGSPTPPVASVDAVIANPKGPQDLRYVLAFTEVAQRFELVDERVENDRPVTGQAKPYFHYNFNGGRPTLNVKGRKSRALQREDVDFEKSILSQRRDPDQYPEITYLGQTLGRIRLYREWSFGRSAMPRKPQKTDLPNDMLEPDSSNLALVLNRLDRDSVVKQRLLAALSELYDGIKGYGVQIEGGTVQVFLEEKGGYLIPATRLSDGTLRYLCLLAVLCHPSPPPLLCIEEPELGLHPDVLPALADLLKEASRRTQLVITTHSDVLVDAMTDCPQAVLVAEKGSRGTTLKRLDEAELKPWLEKYRLGQLWARGDIGGTRW